MAKTRLTRFAPVTTRFFNPLMKSITARLPGFGVVTHVGRTTGKTYRAPVLVIGNKDGYVIALWYGSQAHWVKNVRAAGRCLLRTRGHDYRLVDPELVTDGSDQLLPLPLRFGARLLRVSECLTMRRDV